MSEVTKVLEQRGNRYGRFDNNAALTQELKEVLRKHPGWNKLEAFHKEALDMIMHKISRAMNGDPNYDDNFVDIAGYSQLTVDMIREYRNTGEIHVGGSAGSHNGAAVPFHGLNNPVGGKHG